MKDVSSIFIPPGGSRNDSALQSSSSTNFDGSIGGNYKKSSDDRKDAQKVYAAETQFGDATCEPVGDASNDSIIPETECDTDISYDEEVSFQAYQNDHQPHDASKIDFNASTSTLKSMKIAENNQSQKNDDTNGSDDTDYICIASDSTQTQMLQSQAILANADDCLNSLNCENGGVNKSPQKNGTSIKTTKVSTISNYTSIQQLVAERSSSVTPDLDLSAFSAENEKKSNTSLDDSDFFDACTQQTVVRVPPKKTAGTSTATDEDSCAAHKVNDIDKSAQETDSNHGNDVYEAQTQMLSTTIETKTDFVVPPVPKFKTPIQSRTMPNRPKNGKISMAKESSDDIFDAATQRMQDDDDIFEVATQAAIVDNLFDQPTQVLLSTSSGKPSKEIATKKVAGDKPSTPGKVRLGTQKR